MSDEQWVALLTEIRALAKARAPLDAGLASLARDVGGRVGREAGRIAAELRSGIPLDQSLSAIGFRSAPAYAAIVQAGTTSGRLAEALEASIESSAAAAELKRRLVVALVYPAIVAMCACGVLSLVGSYLVPRMVDFVHTMRLQSRFLRTFLPALETAAPYLAGIAGAILLVTILLMLGLAPDWLTRWAPGLRRWPRLLKLANFADLLALLVEQKVPLPESLRLAGHAVADSRLERSAEALAGACENGVTHRTGASGGGLPASMHLLLAGPLESARLSASLKRISATYRSEIEDVIDAARTRLPAVCVTLVAGTAVLIFGLCEFVPMTEVLRGLGHG